MTKYALVIDGSIIRDQFFETEIAAQKHAGAYRVELLGKDDLSWADYQKRGFSVATIHD